MTDLCQEAIRAEGCFDPWLSPLFEAFRSRGKVPFDWQREAWEVGLTQGSGLIHAPTGMGKTWAALGGVLARALHEQRSGQTPLDPSGPRLLWVTPLRALARDTSQAITEAAALVGLPWRVRILNADTASGDRVRIRRGDYEALVTTPESLALLLSYADAHGKLAQVANVIVDEWHELLGDKRGVLLNLNLERLRRLVITRNRNHRLAVLGLSATLGNLATALEVLLGPGRPGRIISGETPKPVIIDSLLPSSIEHFSWSGHFGLEQLPRVMAAIAAKRSTLIFTNTRAQAERWYEAIASTWMDDPDRLGIHHGSLDLKTRAKVERGLREGRIACVVATSSLDLGVDFPCVDQVIQIGSPKGIARLLQRAGRSGHRPGATSCVLCVPTHALELLDLAALRRAVVTRAIESREPRRACFDVLAQHIVTSALAGPIRASELFDEARSTYAFRDLTDEEWQRVLTLVTRGGDALAAYPDFRRVREEQGWLFVDSPRIARIQRQTIGTIVADGEVVVRYRNGTTLGHLEESFIARLTPGDRFLFAGRSLELLRVRNLTAYVRPAPRRHAIVPRWMGGRMPLSTRLAEAIGVLLAEPFLGEEPELRLLRPLLERQQHDSHLPKLDELLVERVEARDGTRLFVYPIAGRDVHEGLAALVAARLAMRAQGSYGWAVNDYGFVVGARTLPLLAAMDIGALFSTADLERDLAMSLNLGDLARRRFREVARIAGLVVQGPPGRTKSLRQLAASAGIVHDVLREHEPQHLLLRQADTEALDLDLDRRRLEETLATIARRRVVLRQPQRLTPFAFPLWAESIRGRLSNEDWTQRVRRMAERLEASA